MPYHGKAIFEGQPEKNGNKPRKTRIKWEEQGPWEKKKILICDLTLISFGFPVILTSISSSGIVSLNHTYCFQNMLFWFSALCCPAPFNLPVIPTHQSFQMPLPLWNFPTLGSTDVFLVKQLH